MTSPCTLAVTITGSLPKKNDNPPVPTCVNKRIESTRAAFMSRATLVHLQPSAGTRPGAVPAYRVDIRLQGEGETVA